MEERFYPCVFIMNDYSERDKELNYVAFYRFKSSKSNLFYIVRLEVYEKHVYGVKFFLKKMNFSQRKYSFITNTNEPRTIVYSIFHLMMKILSKDSLASFMFIGNADEGADYKNTRRYRFYSQMVRNKISDRYFLHIVSDEASLYVLLNKQSLAKDRNLQESVMDEFFKRFVQEETHSDTRIRLNRYWNLRTYHIITSIINI